MDLADEAFGLHERSMKTLDAAGDPFGAARRTTPTAGTATSTSTPPGTSDNTLVDPGDGHVHLICNETASAAKTMAVQLVPTAATRRQDVTPVPQACPGIS